jgi:hypothetical protein
LFVDVTEQAEQGDTHLGSTEAPLY